MKSYRTLGVAIFIMLLVPAISFGVDCGPRPCIPDRPVPPESVGPIGIPFDIPIWPTLVKTEFHIMPWVNFGKLQLCIPYTGKSIELPAPCLSLKPIPVWFPWLRPIDAECGPGSEVCRVK